MNHHDMTRNMVLAALFAALTAIGAFLQIPTGTVPITLQFLFTALAGLLLGWKWGAISQLLYVGIGLLGLPVFTQGGGIGYVLQPSFGFLLGLIPAAAVIGALTARRTGYLTVLAAVLVGDLILYAVGALVCWRAPELYFEYLMLDARAILHGQIWRIVTFLMWPLSGDLFLNVLVIYCYYNLGRTLEAVWGSFRFNVYFFMGIIGHVLAAILIYALTGRIYPLTAEYLNFSLFFAYAATFPDAQFLLFFVIPIKAKWLALFDGAYFLYGMIFGGMASRIAIVMSLLNFILYFVMSRSGRYNPKEIKRKQQFRSQVTQTVREAKQNGRHRCAVCGRTDLDDPELVFRFCSKCEGDYEYCQDHLYTHKHVTKGGMDPRQKTS